jgi:predicted GNAT family N-acyltransferase
MPPSVETIRIASVATNDERALAGEIRRVVFVLEQGVPLEVEVDGKDGDALHFLAWVGARAAATARLRRTSEGHKLERVAVLQEFRGQGVGGALVRHVLSLPSAAGMIYVHAQHGALGFWERLGFIAEGPTFVEGGIDHRRMWLNKA